MPDDVTLQVFQGAAIQALENKGNDAYLKLNDEGAPRAGNLSGAMGKLYTATKQYLGLGEGTRQRNIEAYNKLKEVVVQELGFSPRGADQLLDSKGIREGERLAALAVRDGVAELQQMVDEAVNAATKFQHQEAQFQHQKAQFHSQKNVATAYLKNPTIEAALAGGIVTDTLIELLKNEFSIENYNYLHDVKPLVGDGGAMDLGKFQEIYNTYIKPNAPQELNLSHGLRTAFEPFSPDRKPIDEPWTEQDLSELESHLIAAQGRAEELIQGGFKDKLCKALVSKFGSPP